MPLPDDLLEQAVFLLGREQKKPRQASLRRAVSTAYYATFHLLANEAAAQASPASPAGLSYRVQRAIEHTSMKKGAKSFEANNLPKLLKPLLTSPLDPSLISLASDFIQLQEERHIADYDLSAKFDRGRAGAAIARAKRLFHNWAAIRNSDASKVFLSTLMFSKQWERS